MESAKTIKELLARKDVKKGDVGLYDFLEVWQLMISIVLVKLLNVVFNFHTLAKTSMITQFQMGILIMLDTSWTKLTQ